MTYTDAIITGWLREHSLELARAVQAVRREIERIEKEKENMASGSEGHVNSPHVPRLIERLMNEGGADSYAALAREIGVRGPSLRDWRLQRCFPSEASCKKLASFAGIGESDALAIGRPEEYGPAPDVSALELRIRRSAAQEEHEENFIAPVAPALVAETGGCERCRVHRGNAVRALEAVGLELEYDDAGEVRLAPVCQQLANQECPMLCQEIGTDDVTFAQVVEREGRELSANARALVEWVAGLGRNGR